jgi:hypothetical protein
MVKQLPTADGSRFAHEKRIPYNLRYYQKIYEYTSIINAGKTALFLFIGCFGAPGDALLFLLTTPKDLS